MLKTLIIYESKYGTTARIAKYLSMVLGPAKYCRTNELDSSYEDSDFIIVGSPIYGGKIDPRISEFVRENAEWLKQKRISLFCTCISPEDGYESLGKLEKILGPVITAKALGGTLNLSILDSEDSKALEKFSDEIGFNLEDIDHFNLEEVINYALELKWIKDDSIPKMPSEELKKVMEEFLKTHNTCTLSTAYKGRIRSTPIEYIYNNGFIYLLSEGGEKFANIILNNQVSLAIYEDYTDMDNLAGMQITGQASIVQDKDEYEHIINMKGLNINFIHKMPIDLNMIKIKIQKIEFLYSKLKKMGHDSKQIYIKS